MMLAVLLLACDPADPATPPSAPAAEAPAGDHPGTVTFVDRDAGTSREEAASGLPESIAWYRSGDARVPVVRIETASRGDFREIFRYGPDGALLDVTTGR